MLLYLIIGCEIAFWIFVIAGLFARYILGKKKLGAGLLIATPIIDLILLTTTIIDLRTGGTANFTHGIAAIYLGVTVAFGHSLIKWADERFAYFFAGGVKPTKKFGKAHAKRERIGWLKHLLSYLIGSTLLLLLIYLSGNKNGTDELLKMIYIWSIVVAIDFVISFSYSIWPKQQKQM